MQLGVFPYGLTFGDTLKVGRELRRIHHGYCELQDGEMRGSGPVDSQG